MIAEAVLTDPKVPRGEFTGGDHEGATPEQALVKDPHTVHSLVRERRPSQKHVTQLKAI